MRHAEDTPLPVSVPPHPSQSGHSGQWGLASVLLGGSIVFLFPIFLALEWLCLYAIDTARPGLFKSEMYDYGILTGYVGAGLFVFAAVLSLLSALIGLRYAFGRHQPAGLPLAGLVAGVAALLLSLVFLYATHEGATWTREQQNLRFGPNKGQHIQVIQPRQGQEG